MPVPTQLVFHGFGPSPALAALVHQNVDRLSRHQFRITSCRVTLDKPHQHHRKGNLFSVRVDLRIPGLQIVVTRSPDLHQAHQDMRVLIHDVFDEACRRLSQVSGRRRDHDRHSEPSRPLIVGRVIRMVREPGVNEGYGFIQTQDGREVYFNGKSVLDKKFDRLKIGVRVRFAEEIGENGPQASTVRA